MTKKQEIEQITPPANWQNKSKPGPKETAPEHVLANREAVDRLFAHFNGNKSKVAKAIGIPVSNVFQWNRIGRISKSSAQKIADHPDLPFTLEQLRADAHTW